MDFWMPGLNGLEVTKRIRSMAEGDHTVIIAVTASAFDEQRQEALAGMDDLRCRSGCPRCRRRSAHLGAGFISTVTGLTAPTAEGRGAGDWLTPAALAGLPRTLIEELRGKRERQRRHLPA